MKALDIENKESAQVPHPGTLNPSCTCFNSPLAFIYFSTVPLWNKQDIPAEMTVPAHSYLLFSMEKPVMKRIALVLSNFSLFNV